MSRPLKPTVSRRAVVMAGTAALLPAWPALSQSRPMLTIKEPSGNLRELTIEDIEALPWQQIDTHTRWTEGIQSFRGPYLTDVLTSGGMSRADFAGHNLLMRALNDFGMVLSADEAWDFQPILACEMNGKRMRVRDKGPIWLVFPRDQRVELQNSSMDARWIWQLFEIDVV